MAPIHILNGDCLADQLKQTQINQNFIVCRECLIDGDVKAENITEFCKIRARFIADSYNTSQEEYFNRTVKELEKLSIIPDHTEVCLWFENDLFCQVNVWFIISILVKNPTLKGYRIFPIIENVQDIWKGFGNANTEQLEKAHRSKIQFTSDDLNLGKNLWSAFQNGDLDLFMNLSQSKSNCFEYLKEVCQAHIDRFPADKSLGRPEKLLQELIVTYPSDFNKVFYEFSVREGIYGFGDLQIKTISEKLMNSQ